MSDLISNTDASLTETSRALSATDRRRAALAIAEAHPDRHLLAYFLVALGLAEPREDGCIVSTRNLDDESWFIPNRNYRPKEPYRVMLGSSADTNQSVLPSSDMVNAPGTADTVPGR